MAGLGEDVKTRMYILRISQPVLENSVKTSMYILLAKLDNICHWHTIFVQIVAVHIKGVCNNVRPELTINCFTGSQHSPGSY